MKKNPNEDIFIFIQFILVVILFILAAMAMFIPNLNIVAQIVLAFLLFVTGINNHRKYKRKFLTAFYFIIGVAVLIALI